MLHGEVFVLHPPGGLFRFQQGLFHVTGNIHLAGLAAGTGNPGRAVQVILEAGDEGGNGQAAFGEQLGNELVRVLGQGEHQVLLFHVHMLIFDGERLGAFQRGNGLLRELIHIHKAFLL